MTKLDSDQWRQVSPHLDEALELDPSAREPWLADLEKLQPQIARELRELLNLVREEVTKTDTGTTFMHAENGLNVIRRPTVEWTHQMMVIPPN